MNEKHTKIGTLAGLFIALLLVFSPVLATDVIVDIGDIQPDKYCANNTHLRQYWEYDVCEGDTCSILNVTKDLFCRYNCSHNSYECSPPPTERYIYLFLIFIAFITVLFILLKVRR